MERLAQFIRDRAKETYPEPITEGHSAITAQMAERVAKLLPAQGVVLDVGCGQGPALEWFTKAGFYAVGYSVNDEDVAACVAKGFRAGYSDMHDLDAADGWIDCVWARHVLEHSIAPFFALHEFNRVLKIGGILYLEMPAPDTSCGHTENVNHYSVMTLSMWLSLVRRSGFTPIEVMEIKLQTGAGPDTYFSFTCRKTK